MSSLIIITLDLGTNKKDKEKPSSGARNPLLESNAVHAIGFRYCRLSVAPAEGRTRPLPL